MIAMIASAPPFASTIVVLFMLVRLVVLGLTKSESLPEQGELSGPFIVPIENNCCPSRGECQEDDADDGVRGTDPLCGIAGLGAVDHAQGDVLSVTKRVQDDAHDVRAHDNKHRVGHDLVQLLEGLP